MMKEIVVGIHWRMVKQGSKDIDLMVDSLFEGRLSPCLVTEDWVNRSLIGGDIESIEQIFQYEVAKHPEYVVKGRLDHVLVAKDE
jgi:hypothetical protein